MAGDEPVAAISLVPYYHRTLLAKLSRVSVTIGQPGWGSVVEVSLCSRNHHLQKILTTLCRLLWLRQRTASHPPPVVEVDGTRVHSFSVKREIILRRESLTTGNREWTTDNRRGTKTVWNRQPAATHWILGGRTDAHSGHPLSSVRPRRPTRRPSWHADRMTSPGARFEPELRSSEHGETPPSDRQLPM